MTTVFVLNAGSSSIKYTVLDEITVVADGIIERIGVPGSGVPDHATALATVLDEIGGTAIDAVGHRIVHGGERFTAATVIDDAVEVAIDELSELAPLHNPAGLAGIRAARAALPDVPHVAVFDTAFHATIPVEAATYAIDAELAARTSSTSAPEPESP
ncbi:MAG: acetate kinase, partial [Pseudolysinimonas sp.]